MHKNIYALYDNTAKAFLNSLHFINHGDAVRWLTTVVNDKEQKTNVNTYPQQFALYYLGTFDDQTGEHQNEKQHIMEATSVQEEQTKFTVKELMEILDKRYDNVVDINTAMEKNNV